MASFTDLVKSQEFAQSSQPKRKQMFDDWKSTNLDPILAEQPAATRIQADQKLQQVFDRISPAPEGEFFGDIGTSFSAGVDTAQALTAEVGVQAAELALDVTGREQETPLLRSLDEQLGPDSYLRQYYDRTSNELKQFSLEQQKEAEETKKGLSGLAQDKQITLKELQDATESDGAEAWATAKFYLDPANFDALINLSVESAPSTAVAVGATVAGGLVAGPAGASVAAVATEGALGAGEASMGAYNTAYQELKKQGLTDDEANTEALRISRTAAGIGGAASAVLGKLGDAGAVAKQFGKGATKEAIDEAVKRTVAQKARRGLGVAASAVTPLVGEGLQGAAVQIAENIAVDEVVETPWNEGAITAGVTEALAAGPTTAATAGAGATTRRLGAEIQRRAEERAKDPDVIAAREQEFLEDALEVEIDVAMDRADEILRTQQPTIEIEDELDAQSTADQEKDRQAEAVTLDQELDSTALTGGLDSTGSDLPTEQPTSTDEDTGSPDSTATTNDSQGTAGTQSEDGVLGGGESATAPPTTGPAQQTETAAPGAGDGTATDGQESGPADSTGVNIDQGATPSGSIEQQGSDSASADLVTDARSIPDPENVAVQWDDMLEDVVDGEIVSPELSYADLTEEGKLFWKQAVEDGYGSAARAEEIMRTELRNGTTPRTAPATDVSQYTPQVIQDIRTGTVSDNQTTGATASLTNPNTMPVILDRGTTQPALPVNTVAAPDTLEGAAGAINAAIKASNKQSGKPAQNGSYMIADPANGVAHIMTRAGSLVRTVPFASIDIAAPVHTVNTPDGAVGYQRVQVKKKNQVRKTRNGNPDVYHYDGIAYPTTMDASLKPAGGGFSGIVYIAKDALPENRVAPNIPTGPINANIADQNLTNETVDPDIAEVVNFNRRLPSNIVQMLPNADRGEPATTVGDIIDAMIADATANNDRYYMDVLAKIAPFIRDVKISAKQSAVPEEPNVAGYYSSQEDAIVLSYRNGADYHTITHELVHAATVHAAFYSDSARSRKVREQIEAAFETYKAVAAGTDTANEYGLTNSLEFLSEIFTNPNFKAQLDSVLGTQRRSDMTLYERIVDAIKSLFGLNPSSDFSADNVLEWTMLLFETSRDLARTQPSITSSNRGRSMADVINDRNSVGNNPLTRRNVANAMYWARMNLWAKYVYNNTAEFLTFLNLRTRVPKETEDHDSHRLYQVFKLIPQRVNRIKQSFNDTTFRSINNQVNELAKASDLGMSKRDIHNDAARYAQLKHIANATRVVRNGLQNEIAQANLRIKELQDQQKALRGEIPADETEEQTAERDATAVELANEEIQWLEFRAEQARQAYGNGHRTGRR